MLQEGAQHGQRNTRINEQQDILPERDAAQADDPGQHERDGGNVDQPMAKVIEIAGGKLGQ